MLSRYFFVATLAVVSTASVLSTRENLVSPAAQGDSHGNNAFTVSNSQDQIDAVAKIQQNQVLSEADSSASDEASTSYPTPNGYAYVFGPVSGANNANGYMGYAFLDSYDPQECADECNKRAFDTNGGLCQYFNIWQSSLPGTADQYVCSMYYLPTDKSTATNTGQGNLTVSASRGYRRLSVVPDGSFQKFPCSGSFCFSSSYAYWVGKSDPNGTLDASIFYYRPYAHLGNTVGLLGSAYGVDSLSGTLAPRYSLNTVPGAKYILAWFFNNAYSGPTLESSAHFEVRWNGETVADVNVGYTGWQFASVEVTAVGNDLLAFYGGAAPAYTFIDDVYAFMI